MPDREKVIKGLETAVKNFERYDGDEYGREYDYARVGVDVLEDAIALLKAQEPRVMTYDELATFDGAFLIESSAISQLDWVFFFDTDTKSDAIWVEGFDGERYVVYREDYGTYTRCWTSRPTDEQREAVKWDD